MIHMRVGKTYKLDHRRFGKAVVRITQITDDGVWHDVLVLSGELRGVSLNCRVGPGGTHRVRACQCRYTAIKGDKPDA